MGKKKNFDHQITDNIQNHQHSNQHKRQGRTKKRSEESQLLHKLNTHFKKLSKTRSKMTPLTVNVATATTNATDMHACNGGSPCNSSSTSTRFFDVNDDHYNFDYVSAALKRQLMDYSTRNGCSGDSESESPTVTMSVVVGTEIHELFGGDFIFAPDLNVAHSLVHMEFVADCDGVGFGLGFGFGSTYLIDPIAFDYGFDGFDDKYTSDILKLSSQEVVIQEFLKYNLFD